MALTKRTYVDGQTIITAANLNDIQDHIITVENNYVPKTRTVAGKALSSNITLAASDVGAVPTSRTINAKALTGNITLSAADVGAVPVARTVNGKALSSNITLNAADVSAVPTTRTVNSKALSADISLTASDVGAVPTGRTVNGKALSSNITLSSGDIGDDSDVGGSTVKASLSSLAGSLDVIRSGLCRVINGNKSPVWISKGVFVFLVNSTISGRNDGIYIAAQNIPTNTAIDSTYLTTIYGGAFNNISKPINPPDIANATKQSVTSGTSTWITSTGAWYCLSCVNGSTAGICAAYIHNRGFTTYYAGLTAGENATGARCVTPWLYFPSGVEFGVRPFYTDANSSGLLIANPL